MDDAVYITAPATLGLLKRRRIFFSSDGTGKTKCFFSMFVKKVNKILRSQMYDLCNETSNLAINT